MIFSGVGNCAGLEVEEGATEAVRVFYESLKGRFYTWALTKNEILRDSFFREFLSSVIDSEQINSSGSVDFCRALKENLINSWSLAKVILFAAKRVSGELLTKDVLLAVLVETNLLVASMLHLGDEFLEQGLHLDFLFVFG